MPYPPLRDLITPTSTGASLPAQTINERLLLTLAMLATGFAPDGTPLPGGGNRAFLNLGPLTTTATGTVSGGTSTPPVAGYAAWYDASQITGQADGSALASWPDLSGNGHTLTQATGVNQPAYYSTTPANLINGKPTVFFNGNDWLNAAFAVLPVGTVFLVTKTQQTVNASVFINGDAGAGPTISNYAVSAPFNWSIGWTTNVTPGNVLSDTNVHCFSAVYNGASSSLQIDSASYGPVTLPTGTLSTLTVGAYNSGAGYVITGWVCELVIYSGSLTAPQITSTYTYLHTKWGTP